MSHNPSADLSTGNEAGKEVCVDCEPSHPQPSDKGVKGAQEEHKEVDGGKKEDLLDPATFVPPLNISYIGSGVGERGLPTPLVVIEVSVHPLKCFVPPSPFLR